MQDRENVLELFEEKKDYYEERKNNGIERYRKGDARLVIVNSDGKILPGARIKVKQKTHEFRFGANIFMLDEFDDPDYNAEYRRLFREYFNLATVPFFWKDNEREEGMPRYDKNCPRIYRRPPTDLCVEYCEANGLTFTKVNQPAEMVEYVEDRVDSLMEKYADIITIYVD